MGSTLSGTAELQFPSTIHTSTQVLICRLYPERQLVQVLLEQLSQPLGQSTHILEPEEVVPSYCMLMVLQSW